MKWAHKPLTNFVTFPKAVLRVAIGDWAEDVTGTKCMRMTVAVCSIPEVSGRNLHSFLLFLLLSLSQRVSIQLWLKCALFQPPVYLCFSQTDESLRRYYQAGAVRTIMNLWQFQDREVWSSWHVVVHNSGALAEVLENEWIFLTLLLASALISPIFFSYLRRNIHFHIYMQNIFPGLLL